jgi:hypothetical protein
MYDVLGKFFGSKGPVKENGSKFSFYSPEIEPIAFFLLAFSKKDLIPENFINLFAIHSHSPECTKQVIDEMESNWEKWLYPNKINK